MEQDYYKYLEYFNKLHQFDTIIDQNLTVLRDLSLLIGRAYLNSKYLKQIQGLTKQLNQLKTSELALSEQLANGNFMDNRLMHKLEVRLSKVDYQLGELRSDIIKAYYLATSGQTNNQPQNENLQNENRKQY